MNMCKYKWKVYSSAFLPLETSSWNWDIGHDSLSKPDISVRDLFGQPLKALLSLKYSISISHENHERGPCFSCTAALQKGGCLGRLLWKNVKTKGFPFLRREAPTALLRQERHIAYIPLILFLTSTLLWHLSKNRTVSTFIFCSSCFPAKDKG